MSQTSRRFVLRERTAAAHAELDAMVGAWASLADYRIYLAAIAGFRPAAERFIAARLLPGGLHSLAIADLLEADMRDLGVSARAAFMPTMSKDVATTCGVLYVLEGSALGARVLFRRAADLGLGDGYGARHLGALSSDAQSWRHFLTVLETIEPFDMDRAVAAAAATFAVARQSFEGAAHAA